MAIPTAMILPLGADEATVDAQIRLALGHGLVPCVRANVRHDQPFRVTFIAPNCVPAGWRTLAVKTAN